MDLNSGNGFGRKGGDQLIEAIASGLDSGLESCLLIWDGHISGFFAHSNRDSW